MADLANALTGRYTIDGELGGGGMSRVFLATEQSPTRQVVIKVFPPDMVTGLNRERFHREIQLAATLQHPHIVPLLTAGTVSLGDDQPEVLYYVMPYITGESLRAKLRREGELPVNEAVRVLEEVTDALAYAHRHDVVHRDIKPDNVLLSDGHAVVTDFGVAKAVSSSSEADGSELTSVGIALGTPTYMPPEQAAADPHVDHRADIYSLGAMGYEMLSGRPPFEGSTPQQIIAAHIAEEPTPISERRSSVPAEVTEIIMRCLAKRAADRWQTADQIRTLLRSARTPADGMTPEGTASFAGASTGAPRHHKVSHVVALYAAVSLGVLGIAYGLMIALGLPAWVVPAAGALLVIGAPIMVLTTTAERSRTTSEVRTDGTGVPAPLRRWFTWRKALGGGALAFAALTVAVTLYMGMRVLGIGPPGTLMAAGLIEDQERLILADFANTTSDSTLGRSVTELFRIDISQSPNLNLMPPAEIGTALGRMQRDPTSALTEDVAREMAQREGIKAVISGEILSVGENVVVSASLIEARTGQVLTAERVTTSFDAIIESVDDLSAKVRECIGESLRSIRADPPLERVTTRSLTALQKYVQSEIPFNMQDYERAATLLEEAIAADSTFAMAFRRLGITAINRGNMLDSASVLFTRAFELRDRLTARERYLAEAVYHQYVQEDDDASIAAYRTVLETYPNDRIALNNLGNHFQTRDRYDDAAGFYLRSIEAGGAPANTYSGAVHSLGHSADLSDAERVLTGFAAAHPETPSVRSHYFELATARRDYEVAEAHIDSLRLEHTTDEWQQTAFFWEAGLARVHGRLAEAERLTGRARIDSVTSVQRFFDALDAADRVMYMFDDQERAQVILDSVMAGPGEAALMEMDPDNRPYQWLVELYSRAGRPDVARNWLAEYEAQVDPDVQRERHTHAQLGWLALAENDPTTAIEEFQQARQRDRLSCSICSLYPLAVAFDQAGNADSAIATLEQYLDNPYIHRFSHDQNLLHLAYRMLGALYEERGDVPRAVQSCLAFVNLLRDADAELQPVVSGVQSRIETLTGENTENRRE